jgi:hypothetical protein
VSLVLLPWTAFALVRCQGAWSRRELAPATAVAVAALAVLLGAAGGILTRTLVPPFGRVAWGWAWLLAGVVVVAGTTGVQQQIQSALPKHLILMLVIAPAAAVGMDWWTRSFQGLTRRAAAAGQMPLERARILGGLIEVTDIVVKYLPVLLLVAGVVAGHFLGAFAGRSLAPALAWADADARVWVPGLAGNRLPTVAQVGADFGALAGRVAGALAGALLAVALLRLYRVEEGAPWPGQGDRPYPRALAALYLLASAALVVIWFV